MDKRRENREVHKVKIQPFFEAVRGERCKDIRKENPANGLKQFNFNRDRFSAFG